MRLAKEENIIFTSNKGNKSKIWDGLNGLKLLGDQVKHSSFRL